MSEVFQSRTLHTCSFSCISYSSTTVDKRRTCSRESHIDRKDSNRRRRHKSGKKGQGSVPGRTRGVPWAPARPAGGSEPLAGTHTSAPVADGEPAFPSARVGVTASRTEVCVSCARAHSVAFGDGRQLGPNVPEELLGPRCPVWGPGAAPRTEPWPGGRNASQTRFPCRINVGQDRTCRRFSRPRDRPAQWETL